MINWVKIAEEIAGAAYDDTRVSVPLIESAATSTFFFKERNYPARGNPPESYRLIYSYVVTLGRRTAFDDTEKVNLLIQFSEALFLKRDFVLKTAVANGYKTVETSTQSSINSFSERNFHKEIVTHCEQFYVQGHYFTAVSEACKAYNLAVKKKVSSTKDGRDLMLSELGKDKFVRCVPGNTESEQNLLEGIKFLSAGLIQGFRNPTSHETHKSWDIGEQDCLDILSLASYLFRQLDKSTMYAVE
jgi:uncharacterized protein (TIGR02391 family)